MFGVDDATLDRIRARQVRGPRRVRVLVVLPLLVLAGVACVPVALLAVVNRPALIQRAVDWAQRNAKARIAFEDLEVLPVGRIGRPSSWIFAVTGLSFTPLDPKKPDWRVARGTLPLPQVAPEPGWRRAALHWSSLDVDGLVITAHQQRPPPPWRPARQVVTRLSADVVRLRRASFEAPEDAPLGRAQVHGIAGEVRDVVFDPGAREVSGTGRLAAVDFVSGAIVFTELDLPTFVLDRSTLRFDGTFAFGGRRGTLEGAIHTFHVKPRVAIRAQLADASVAQVVRSATGRDSPVSGRLDLDVRVEAGGERPRGCSRITGEVGLREGRIQLDPRTRYLVLDLVRLAPWVTLNAYKEIELADANGLVTLTRGTFTLRDLRYPAGRRQIRLDGTIGTDALWLLVRLLPRDMFDGDDRLGLAVAVEGQGQRQQVRLAARSDVFRPTPWLPRAWEDAGGPPDGLPCGTFTIQ